MNIISWNVNGLRAVHKKGALAWLIKESPDIFCFQETKCEEGQAPEELISLVGYHKYFSSSQTRKGYSGVAIYVKESINHKKIELQSKDYVSFETLQTEGRLLCLEFDRFFLINCYFPNGGGKPERLTYKIKFYKFY